MTIPTMPPPPTREASASRSDRFFLWISEIGVARTDGWIGGVSAGIAARLRIDPLIVRGVFIAATLVGLPMIFLYALAWALLPDADGRVHARDLIHGQFQPVQIGILATALIGLIPSASILGGWSAAIWYNPFQYEWSYNFGWTPLSIFGWLIGVTLAGVLLVLIVRAARRTPGVAAPRPSMASTDSAAPDASVNVDGSGSVDAADAIESDAGALADSAAPASALINVPLSDPSAPAAPDASAAQDAPTAPATLPAGERTSDDLEAWRQQHAAWKEQDQAWRRQQQDAERAAKEQLRRERQAAAGQFAAEAAERRRIRRASNPRASVAYVAAAAGLALIVGAIVGLTSDSSIAVALGLFVAGFTLACAMIITGIARRRSGFLAFLTMIVVGAGLIVGAPAALVGNVVAGNHGVSNYEPTSIRQLFGDTTLTLIPLDNGASNAITVQKNAGQTHIYVNSGVTLELTAVVGDASVNWQRNTMHADGSSEYLEGGSWSGSNRADGTTLIDETVSSAPLSDAESTTPTVVPVTIEQRTGVIHITYFESDEESSR